MPLWQAALLGIIQGLTEFLPISSTAHLLVTQELLGRSRDELQNDPFTVVIQLGTLLAVYWYFRADLVLLTRGFLRDLAEGRIVSSGSPDGRMAKLIIIGTLPAVIVGLVGHRWLKATFYNPMSIAIAAIVFAVLMTAAEWWSARRASSGQKLRGDDELSTFDALWIGCFQALALMPGGSRSGTTITAGLFCGLSRPAAARFSFLLSLPSILAAGLKELYDWLTTADADRMADQAAAMVVGGIVSALVGYLSIAWLLRFLRDHTLLAFAIYRVLLALVIFALLAAGVLSE